jgi:hypothetical protein
MSKFKKFLADRGRLFAESNVIDMTFVAESNPEENTPFLMGADALEEEGYSAVPAAIRFFANPSKDPAEHDIQLSAATAELKAKASNNNWFCDVIIKGSIQQSIQFSKLKPNEPSKYKIILIDYHQLSLSFMAYTTDDNSMRVPFKILLTEVTHDQSILICAAALFLMARAHQGVPNNTRIMKSLNQSVSRLVHFDPSSNMSAAQVSFLVQFIREIEQEFRVIKNMFPNRAKEAADIIKNNLKDTRWNRCLSKPTARSPYHCAHFANIREILWHYKY